MTNEILVIDDNSDIRLLISSILKDKGFAVREAANFDQAKNEIDIKSIVKDMINSEIRNISNDQN